MATGSCRRLGFWAAVGFGFSCGGGGGSYGNWQLPASRPTVRFVGGSRGASGMSDYLTFNHDCHGVKKNNQNPCRSVLGN